MGKPGIFRRLAVTDWFRLPGLLVMNISSIAFQYTLVLVSDRGAARGLPSLCVAEKLITEHHSLPDPRGSHAKPTLGGGHLTSPSCKGALHRAQMGFFLGTPTQWPGWNRSRWRVRRSFPPLRLPRPNLCRFRVCLFSLIRPPSNSQLRP